MFHDTSSEGRTYWKSVDEIHPTPETQAVLAKSRSNEFPENYDAAPPSGVNRRTFMGLLSASMALTAVGCRRPDHKIISTVRQAEYTSPGLPNYYSTVYSNGNAAIGLLVKVREGRPTKIEGNDLHPASNGASSAQMQASLLNLYDPDRVLKPARSGGKSLSTLDNALETVAKAIQSANGKSVYLLMGEHASPSLAKLVSELQTATSGLKVAIIPDLVANGAAEANKALLGFDGEFVVDYSKADVILSVDADFLGSDKMSVRNIRTFAQNRKPHGEHAHMSRLLAVESNYTLTGAQADKRVRISPEEITGFLGAVLAEVSSLKSSNRFSSLVSAAGAAYKTEEAKAFAKELIAKQGLVVVGAHAGVAANTLGQAINVLLEAIGEGKPMDPAHTLPMSNSKVSELAKLRADLASKNIATIIYADVNPYYSAHKELSEALAQVPNQIAFSQYDTETAAKCTVFIPVAHGLESWGDAKNFDGSLSIQQPLISPLNTSSASLGDILLMLGKKLKADFYGDKASYYDVVRANWETEWHAVGSQAFQSFDAFWEQVMRDGIWKRTSGAVSLSINESNGAAAVASGTKISGKGDYTLLITPSYAVGDGSMANNGWLQELPDGITKITWDNVALVSQATAQKLGLAGIDQTKMKAPVVKISNENGSIELPLWVQPGVADGVLATVTGYGRTHVGVVADNVGANAYSLLGASGEIGYVKVSVENAGKMHPVATTQQHHDLMGRKIVQETTFEKIKNHDHELFEAVHVPGRAHGDKSLPYSITAKYDYKGHRWAMNIDLSACVGCGACVIACQSENNISTVGKEQVINGREMHWMRLDRYYVSTSERGADNPEMITQPMLCQHCENAPCENVCPVAATTHSPEGLNEMTYNRCVGTRYCLNNCPYKVRRFNFLNYNKEKRSPIEFSANPEVTVRMRGVMEKCTFCVQRLHQAKWKAKDAGRARIQDGEAVTACQQACPAAAITFGDVNDPNSAVAKGREDHRGFLVLEEINVRPQITYLAKVRNTTPIA